MRAPALLLPALRRRTRLIWLVLWALLLQPLAWAAQPAARWVALPYCATAAQGPGAVTTAATRMAAPPAAAQAQVPHAAPGTAPAHSLLVLLNPAALGAAPGGPLAPPPAPSLHPALADGGRTLAAAPADTLRLLPCPHATPPSRAPPRLS